MEGTTKMLLGLVLFLSTCSQALSRDFVYFSREELRQVIREEMKPLEREIRQHTEEMRQTKPLLTMVLQHIQSLVHRRPNSGDREPSPSFIGALENRLDNFIRQVDQKSRQQNPQCETVRSDVHDVKSKINFIIDTLRQRGGGDGVLLDTSKSRGGFHSASPESEPVQSQGSGTKYAVDKPDRSRQESVRPKRPDRRPGVEYRPTPSVPQRPPQPTPQPWPPQRREPVIIPRITPRPPPKRDPVYPYPRPEPGRRPQRPDPSTEADRQSRPDPSSRDYWRSHQTNPSSDRNPQRRPDPSPDRRHRYDPSLEKKYAAPATVGPSLYGKMEGPDVSIYRQSSSGSCPAYATQIKGSEVFRKAQDSIIGAWMKDSGTHGSKVWAVEGSNAIQWDTLTEYATEDAFRRRKVSKLYQLPVPCSGLGAVIYKNHLYCQSYNNREQTTLEVMKFSLDRNAFTGRASFSSRDGGHVNHPYRGWAGVYLHLQFAMDELGLWVIFGEGHRKHLAVYRVDPNNLQVLESWRTSKAKDTIGPVFMVCGVLYALDSHYAGYISYVYDTNMRQEKNLAANKITLPLLDMTSIHYNPTDRKLYAWTVSRPRQGRDKPQVSRGSRIYGMAERISVDFSERGLNYLR